MAQALRTFPPPTDREYTRTHSFIDFRLDLSNPDPEFWMLLGEARSKIQHIAGSFLKPEMAFEMHQVYLAKGALGTTAIEGNTLSESEVRQLLEGELKLPPSQEYLAQAVDNIIEAYNNIKDGLLSGTPSPLTPEILADYNRSILRALPLEEGVVPGEIPTHSITVGRYRAAPRRDCEFLLEVFCDWLNGRTFEPPTEEHVVPWALLKAMMAHLYIAWIHPYGDGNGRTARLLELRILLEAGVPMTVAHLLSNHYNLTRDEYYRHLDAASSSQEGVLDFLRYALRGFVDGLHDQLKTIRDRQFADRWEQYIYEKFAGKDSGPERRRRELALAIARATEPVKRSAIRHIAPEVAERYATRTDKTISRDLMLLEIDGLIRRTSQGYTANRQILLGLLPPASAESSVVPEFPLD